jgi:hypothetical protein
MSRTIAGWGIAFAASLTLAPRRSPAAPDPREPAAVPSVADATAPADAPAAPPQPATTPEPAGETSCLPLAVCGCFNERRCVTARVQADGVTVDILDGEHAGETGHLLQDCPSEDAAPADCVAYVNPAMLCRRLLPSADTATKYFCSMDDIHIDYRCGFVDGACSAL